MGTTRIVLSLLTLAALLGPPGVVASATGAEPSGSPTTTVGLPPIADVPMYRMDARRRSIEPGPGPTGTPTIAWSRALDTPPSTFPVLVAGQFIIGDQNGDLVALDARTGAERWRAAGDGALSGTPAAADGVVIVADTTGIMAVDALT